MSTSEEQPSPPTPDAQREKAKAHLPFLDGMRGLAAVWVMVGHSRTEILVDKFGGTAWDKALGFVEERFAVPVFIVLSGFLLSSPLVVDGATRWAGPWAFMLRRAKRLYPAYLLVIALLLLANRVIPGLGSASTERWQPALPMDLPAVLTHVAMIHNLWPQFIQRIDPPMWSLAVEWQIYLIFSIVLVPVFLRKGYLPAAALGLLAIAITTKLDHEFGVLLACFTLGIVAARCSFSSVDVFVKLRASWLPLLITAVAIVAAYLLKYKKAIPLAEFSTGISAASLLVALCREHKPKSMMQTVRNALSGHIARTLGWFSYSLYLIHFPVIALLAAICLSSGIEHNAAALTVSFGGYAISLALAALLAWGVEYRLVKSSPSRLQVRPG